MKKIKVLPKKYYILIPIIVLFSLFLIGCILFFHKEVNKRSDKFTVTSNSDLNQNLKDNNDLDLKEKELKVPVSVNATIPIFMYHFVREDTGDYEYPENMMRPSMLKSQLQYLKDNNFETIYISDIENIHEYQKPVALTFDDGWEDFYINAFPLFKEYNMKATLYVITSLVGTPGYCNLNELRELKESGIVDIQSHTVSHPRLALLTLENAKKEMKESKEYLKNNLDIDSDTICYPYGSFNGNVENIAKELGYKYGLAMDGGIYYTQSHKDLNSIPRIYANRSMTLSSFSKFCNKSNVKVTWK